ncbi:MAG: Flp pilus assembly complex ATPase component TadA [Candidatus Omnitrophica bacterium]|nr:Flp pilus assembly complex ATPase component TadA [Candidatus Omnitrophota bacterium]
MPAHKKLGEILISEGMVTPKQISEAIALQAKEGGRLGEILVKLGYIEEEQIVVALSKQLSLPYITLRSGKLKPAPDQDLDKIIPYEFAIRNLVLPLYRSLNSLTVAIFDPLDLILIDNLKKITGYDINPIITTHTDILKAIDDFYGKGRAYREIVEASYKIEGEGTLDVSSEDVQLSLDRLIAKTEEAPIVKLVDLILHQAIESNASDIHIEPQRNKISLRYRIDGILYEITPPSKSMQLALISRIKLLSKMNIAEKRLPQDGGFVVNFNNKLIDLRVSTMPTIYGEKVVIRILDKARLPLDLSKLGFLPQEISLLKKGLNFPYGLVFITGPTGSGKTTTLYSAINELNDASKNILTVEDPVEFHLDRVNQVQVKPEIGLTFANVLRSFLRQDPDIILVGEVRDLETAEICVRAALTGHLVLSTLHTNTAADSIVRLVDMGIPHYLIAASLRLVAAQRLVRVLCSCKEPYEVKDLSILKGIKLSTPVVYRAKGCSNCNFIGYKGRSIITEVILVDEEIREAIYKNYPPEKLLAIAKKKGTLSLLESGLIRVAEGITSLEEVLSKTTF